VVGERGGEYFLVIGSVAGPHPYPLMVRDFQRVIGTRRAWQMVDAIGTCHRLLWRASVAEAMPWLFYPFLETRWRCSASRRPAKALNAQTRATLGLGGRCAARFEIVTCLPDGDCPDQEAHSVVRGLDYPGVGPEHSLLKDLGRVQYTSVTTARARGVFNCSQNGRHHPGARESHAAPPP